MGKNIHSNYFDRYRWLIAVIFPLALLLLVELGLSVIQIVRKGKDLKPYYVTSVLRPFVRLFIHDDFQPRTTVTHEIPWDTKTDRMRPGEYQPEDKRLKKYRVNSFGIRGKEFTIPKPVGTFRIVIFGGSSTFGAESTDEETSPAVLETILREKVKNQNIEVLNYGMSSKSLYYITSHYFVEVERLQPDIVIINNIRNTAYYDQNQGIFDYDDIVTPDKHAMLQGHRFLEENSLVYRTLVKVFKFCRNVAYGYKKRSFKKGFNRKFHEFSYRKTLESIYRDAKSRGIRFALILEPSYNDNPARQLACRKLPEEKLYSLIEGYDENDRCNYWDAVYGIMHKEIYKLQTQYSDIIVIDPVETLIKNEDQDLEEKIFFDDAHLMPVGNKILAQLIADDLLKNRVIPFGRN